MSRDTSQTHLLPQKKKILTYSSRAWVEANEVRMWFFFFFLINGNDSWVAVHPDTMGCCIELIGTWQWSAEEINNSRRCHLCNHGLLPLLLLLCNYFCERINRLWCLLLSESSEMVFKNHRAGILREWLKIDHLEHFANKMKTYFADILKESKVTWERK